MFNKAQQSAEIAAARIPVRTLLSHLGTWESKSEIKNEVQVTFWTGLIAGEKITIMSMQELSNGREDPRLVFVEGGQLSLPLTKLEFICDALCSGDMRRAIAFAEAFSGLSENWLIELGARARDQDLVLPEIPDLAYESMVDEQVVRLKVSEAAKSRIEEEKWLKSSDLPSPKNLEEWLQEPDEPVTYRIESLWPSGGNIFLVAAYKAGKTTAVKNVTRCLCDGGLFLGKFETQPVDGTVGYINFELNPNQSKAWLRRLAIKNKKKLWTWNLKGFSNPFQTQLSREKFVDELIAKGVEVLIIDPFSGAYRKGDSKDNDLVKQFLTELDEMAHKAGVKEILMAVHAGYDQTHARGASTLGDHPDATWNITKDVTNNKRFFKAEGRDVLCDEEELVMADDGITLSLTGLNKAEASVGQLKMLIENYVKTSPGCTAGAIDAGLTGNNSKKSLARQQLVRDGILIETSIGNSKIYNIA